MNLRNNSLSFEENMSHMIALGEFSEVAYVGEFEFDYKFNIKNPGL